MSRVWKSWRFVESDLVGLEAGPGRRRAGEEGVVVLVVERKVEYIEGNLAEREETVMETGE